MWQSQYSPGALMNNGPTDSVDLDERSCRPSILIISRMVSVWCAFSEWDVRMQVPCICTGMFTCLPRCSLSGINCPFDRNVITTT